MLKSNIRRAVVLVAAAVPTLACSESNFYVGAGIGVGNTSGNYAEQVRNAGQPSAGFKFVAAGRDGGSGTGGRLALGYAIHDRVAIEVAYANYGKQDLLYQFEKTTGLIPAQPFFTGKGQYKLDGATIDVVGSLPVTPTLSANVRLGVLAGSLRYREEQTVLNQGSTLFAKNDNVTKLHWGVGASYRINRSIEATLDYTQAQGVGKSFAWTADTNGKLNYGLFSAGIRYRF